tara:strand:+ start:13013 stop:13201 length:189 start_codon:yes stop_codon:yes gene_type:complete
MKVTNGNPFYGESTMDLDITQDQLDRFNSGVFAQDAFPDLSADGREFLISGFTPEQYKETFG